MKAAESDSSSMKRYERMRRLSHEEGALLTVGALSLALYYITPGPALSAPWLLLFGIVAWRRLDLALCLLPLTFPYWYVPKPLFGREVFPLSELALGVCVFVAVARALLALYSRLGHAPIRMRLSTVTVARLYRVIVARLGGETLVGAALLLAGMTLGVAVAGRRPEALRAWRWEIVEPFLYLLLLARYAPGWRNARRLACAFLGSALILVALATIQVTWLHVTFAPIAEGNRLLPYVDAHGDVHRATAFIYGSGNSLGAWLERAFPLALALALAGRRLGRRTRMLAACCALAYLPPLLWSESRGAEAGAALGAFIILWCVLVGWLPDAARRTPRLLRRVSAPRLRAWMLRGGALVGCLALLIGAGILWSLRAPLLQALLYGHNSSGEERLLLWLAAWHMIKDHPLLGIGPDQFLYYYSNLYTRNPYWITMFQGQRTVAYREPNLSHPHNVILDLWLSAGLLGLVGYALTLWALLKRGWRLWQTASVSAGVSQAQRDAQAWTRPLALGVCASVLAGVAHGMVDSAYFVPDLALAFWMSVALLTMLAHSLPRRGAITRPAKHDAPLPVEN